MNYSTNVNYVAAAKGQITVTAGTFKAIRLDALLESDCILSAHGATFSLYDHSMASSFWLVKMLEALNQFQQCYERFRNAAGYVWNVTGHEYNGSRPARQKSQ